MGSNISIDSAPVPYNTFVKQAGVANTSSEYKSNIKAWSFQSDKQDQMDTKTLPVDFSSLTKFDNQKCYLILHLFRKESKIPLKNVKLTLNGNKTDNSLLDLAISTSKQLSPRGLEHLFSVHDLQTSFFGDTLRTSSNSGSIVSYDLYVWNGKDSSLSLQAYAVTKGFEVERKLLEHNFCEYAFEAGKPISILQYFVNDLPRERVKSTTFLELYKRSHLFRTLVNIDTVKDVIDEHHDKTFRSLLRLPPRDDAPLGEQDDEFMDSPRDDQDEEMSEPKPMFKVPSIPMNALKLPLDSKKRAAPESFTDSDPKRRDTMDSARTLDSSRSNSLDSARSSTSSLGSYRLDLDSIGRSENPLDPSPTPRMRMSDDMRPLSGSELVVYYRKICSKIEDHLFLGSDLVARNKEVLQQNGVTHIVNAALTVCDIYFANDFVYYPLSLYDAGNESVIGAFFGVIEFIEKAINNGGTVYIHCYEGVSRSSTLTIAYLMWKTNQSFNTVVENVKKKRPVTSPNPGFIVQLLQWEKMLANPQYYLYRISALNDMFEQHKQLIPKLCRTNVLDERTCFVLHAAAFNQIFIWIGKELIIPGVEKEAKRLAAILEEYFSTDQIDIVTLTSEQALEDSEFLDLLALCPVEKTQSQEQPYPDLEHMRTVDDKTGIGASATTVEQPLDEESEHDLSGDLYAYPSLDKVEGFDSDDLVPDGIFILHPHATHDDQDLIYVWLGSECNALAKRHESIEYAGTDAGKVFISKKCLPHHTEIVVVEQDEEPEEFWDYFVNG
jgi:predicted protein tyrosine phosphatase